VHKRAGSEGGGPSCTGQLLGIGGEAASHSRFWSARHS